MMSIGVSKRIWALAVVAMAAAVAPCSALTPPALRFADASGNSVTVDSTGAITYGGACTAATCPGTATLGTGTIGFSGTVGAFKITNALGQTSVAEMGPAIDLGLGTVNSTVGGVLTASWTVTGEALTGPVKLNLLTTGGASVNTVYIDPSNSPFALTTAVVSSTVTSGGGNTVTTGTYNGTGTVSITEVAIATVLAGSGFQDDLTFSAAALTPYTPPSLSCLSSSVTTGEVGVPFNTGAAAPTVSGGAAPFTFAVATGALPAGLSLNASTGVVSGTPSATGSFTLKVTDSTGATATATCPYTIGSAVSLSCLTGSANTGTVGTPFTTGTAPTVTGGIGPFTFSVASGSIPAGLTLNTATGAVTGTPTAAGSFSLKVTDSKGAVATSTCPYSFTYPPISLSCLSTSVATGEVGVAFNAPGPTITGGSGTYTFAVATGALPTGLTLNASTGAVTGTPTAAGSFTLKVTDSTGATTSTTCPYTIGSAPSLSCLTGAAATGTVNTPFTTGTAPTVTGGTGPYTFSVASGTIPAGLTLNTSTGAVTGTPTAAGSFSLKVTDSKGAVATSTCPYSFTYSPIVVNCQTISGTEGVAITPVQFNATGGSGKGYTFSANGLPSGLTMSSSGLVSGTPTTSGTTNFTITVTDSAGNTVTVVCSTSQVQPPAVTATCVSITAIENVPINPTQLTATGGVGGPYTFTATNLPSGLTISSSGLISGTPSVSGTFNYTVTITDKAGNKGTLNCSITVTSPCLSLMCPTHTGVVGQLYNSWVVASGGKPAYTYSITSGTLPAGLTLNASTGEIKGTPTSEGTYTLTFKAVDSGTGTAQQTITSNCSIVISKCSNSSWQTTSYWSHSNQWNQGGWGWGGSQNTGTPISWFNCHITKLSGSIPSTNFSIFVSGASISFGGKSYSVPDAEITFSTTQAYDQTVWDAALNRWETTLPIADAYKADEIFASGLAMRMPANTDYSNVTWTADISCNAPGVQFSWQHNSSVWDNNNNGTLFPYLSGSTWTPDYTGMKVNSCHNGTPNPGNKSSDWGWGNWGNGNNGNGDHAGAPEFNNRGNCLLDGGTGKGGQDWCGNGGGSNQPPTTTPCQDVEAPVSTGDAGSKSFWQGSNGQNLIQSLNGGHTATNLSNWLADNFPHSYGVNCSNDLHGKTNDDVCNLYNTFCKESSDTDAQALACALSAYVTNTTLCGQVAPQYNNSCNVSGGGNPGNVGQGYGFHCDENGCSSHYYDVHQAGHSCSDLGLSNEKPYSVIKILQQCDLQKSNGSYNSQTYHDVFNGINSCGGVN